MDPRVAGNKEPIQDGMEIELSSTEAPVVRKFYKGTADQVQNAFNQLAQNANRAVFRQQGALGIAEITLQGITGDPNYPPNGLRVEELSRSSTQVQVSIWDSRYFETFTGFDISAIEGTVAAIKDVRAANTSANPGDAALEAALERDAIYDELVSAYNASPKQPLVIVALDLLLGDAAPPIVFFPVLIYRRVVTRESSLRLASSTEGQCYSTAALPIPGNLLGRMDVPNVANTLAAREHHGFGWLKTVAYGTLSDGGVELIETYTYGSYPTVHYAGSSFD